MHISFLDVGTYENPILSSQNQRCACVLHTPSTRTERHLGARGLSISTPLEAINQYFLANEPYFKQRPDISLDELGVVVTRDHAYAALLEPAPLKSLLTPSDLVYFKSVQSRNNLPKTTHVVFRFTAAPAPTSNHQMIRHLSRTRQDTQLLSRWAPQWPKDHIHEKLSDHIQNAFKAAKQEELKNLFRSETRKRYKYDYHEKCLDRDDLEIEIEAAPLKRPSAFFGSFSSLLNGLTNLKFE